MSGQIFIISGTPAAGKSSVAKALLKHFARGIHISVDDIRDWVVSGYSDELEYMNTETSRQFVLARQTAVATAELYAQQGFNVVIDDVIFPAKCQLQYEVPLRAYHLTRIMLRPTLQETLARNTERHKEFDLTLLDPLIPVMYEAYGKEDLHRQGWQVIDSTHLTIEQTVAQILKAP